MNDWVRGSRLTIKTDSDRIVLILYPTSGIISEEGEKDFCHDARHDS